VTVAVFDYATWALRYPTLATTVTAPLADLYFAEAGLWCDNTDCSPVPADPVTYQPRLMLLGMLVAHIATLNGAGQPGGQASGLVGRVSSATQGSVSVSAEFKAGDGAAWYIQTPYGAQFWAATAAYRTFQFVPAPPDAYPPFGVDPFYGNRGWWNG
jgi:hypothetical protein